MAQGLYDVRAAMPTGKEMNACWMVTARVAISQCLQVVLALHHVEKSLNSDDREQQQAFSAD